MRKIVIFLGGILFTSSIIAQIKYERCSTMENDAELRQIHPQLGTLEDFEAWLAPKVAAYKQQVQNGTAKQTTYNIPVIIHIIHNSGEAVGQERNISYAQAKSQIDVLNEDFSKTNSDFSTTPFVFQSVAADCGITFCLATEDPNGNTLAEPGVNRVSAPSIGANNTASTQTADGYTKTYFNSTIKPATQWDPDRYLNMWVAHMGPTGSGGQLLGYAQFPDNSGLSGLPPGGAANTDGVVMYYKAFGRTGNLLSSYPLGRTATHEVGHWLGLRHIWGDDGGACGNSGDYCNDTPDQASDNAGCPTHPSPSCSNSGDMFMNYMDYSDDACLTMFTNDQKARMMAVMQNSPRRGVLNSSTVCKPMVCDFDTHIGDFDTPSNYPDTDGSPPWGWIAGHNSFQDIAKCEKFYYGDPQQRILRGVEMLFSKAVNVSGSGTIDVVVWASDQSFGGGIPQNIITSETVSISSLNTGLTETYISFSNPPTINSGSYYFVGIMLNYGSPQDTVALYTNADGEGTSTVYSYELWSDLTWAAMESSLSWNKKINFAISPELCYQTVGIEEEIEKELVKIYPNPTQGILNIESEDTKIIEVYNILGNLIYSQQVENNQYYTTINIANQPKGVYIVNVKGKDFNYSKKVILTK